MPYLRRYCVCCQFLLSTDFYCKVTTTASHVTYEWAWDMGCKGAPGRFMPGSKTRKRVLNSLQVIVVVPRFELVTSALLPYRLVSGWLALL